MCVQGLVSASEGRLDASSSIREHVLNSCSSRQLQVAGLVKAVLSLRDT